MGFFLFLWIIALLTERRCPFAPRHDSSDAWKAFCTAMGVVVLCMIVLMVSLGVQPHLTGLRQRQPGMALVSATETEPPPVASAVEAEQRLDTLRDQAATQAQFAAIRARLEALHAAPNSALNTNAWWHLPPATP